MVIEIKIFIYKIVLFDNRFKLVNSLLVGICEKLCYRFIGLLVILVNVSLFVIFCKNRF